MAGPLLAILVATFLRLWPIGSGLPYSDYIDEGHVLHQAIKVLQEQTYDVGLYEYPSLPAYLIAATATACAPVYRLVYGRSLIEEFPSPAEFHTERGDVYDLISPPAFIVLARAAVATLPRHGFTHLFARLAGDASQRGRLRHAAHRCLSSGG